MWPSAALVGATALASLPLAAHARVTPASSLPAGKAAPFLTLAQVEAVLDDLASSYPEFVAGPAELGTSVENRPIRAICVGACGNPRSPGTLLTGLVHAREPLGMMVSLTYAERLLALGRAGDEDALSILTTRRLWVLPVVNPDGYVWNTEAGHYVVGGARMARKNRRPGCGNGRYADVGVDLNRNFDFYWDHDDVGSCPQPCSEDYRGGGAMSEPETKAVAEAVARGNFSVALNFHSYGRFINLPYGVQSLGAPPAEQYAVYLSLARGFAAATGGAYDYGHPWSGGLYSVNGDASDWMFGKHGIWAMSPELGPAFNDPFEAGMWPSTGDAPGLTSEGEALAQYATLAAGPLLEVSSSKVTLKKVTASEDPLCPGSCIRAEVEVVVRNAGVQDAGGDVAVAFLPFSSQPNSPAFCEALGDGIGRISGSGSCVHPWYALGANVCASSLESHAGRPAAFCPVDDAHTRPVPFNLGEVNVATSSVAGAVSGGRRAAAEASAPGSLLADDAPALAAAALVREKMETARRGVLASSEAASKLDEEAMKAARRGLAESLAAAEAAVAERRSRRAAGVGDAANAPEVAAAFAAPVGPGGSGDAPVPGVTFGTPGAVFSGLKIGALPAQRHTHPIALHATSMIGSDVGNTAGMTPEQLLAVQCSAATNGMLHAACSANGAATPWEASPPLGFLAVSDDLHCTLYAVTCGGEVKLMQRSRSSCMPCAMLRNSNWASLLRPGRVTAEGYVVAASPPDSTSGSGSSTSSGTGSAPTGGGLPIKTVAHVDVSWPWMSPDSLAPGGQLALFFAFVVIGVVAVFRFMRALGQHGRRTRLASPRSNRA